MSFPEFLAAIPHGLLQPVLEFYKHNENAGYLLAACMGLFFVASWGLAIVWHFVSVEFELRNRCRFFENSLKLSSLTDVEARSVMAQRWGDVCAEMEGSKYEPFVHAWQEFRETLIDESASPIRNTERPQTFFMSLRGRTKWLETASNLSVGMGLLLTFVGLVAALDAIQLGGNDNSKAVSAQIADLLNAASAKFVTSVAGVGMSLGYRITDRVLSLRRVAELSRISGALERGLLYTSSQHLAAEQARYLSDQTTALKQLATEISVQVGERFAAAVQPVTQSITDLRMSMQQGYEMQAAALRDGAGSAISGSVGAELNALASKLAGVGDSIAQMQTLLGQSGATVSDEIDRAGARLESVSSRMEETFRQLSNQLTSMGSDMSRQAAEEIGGVVDRFQTIFANVEEAGARQQSALSNSLIDMERAMGAAREKIATGAQEAVAKASAEANDTIRASAEAMASVFQDVAQRAQLTVGALKKIEASILQQSDVFQEASKAIRETSSSATAAVSGLRAASVTTESILSKTGELVQLLKTQNELSRKVAEQLGDSARAVADAWEQHSDRFGEVDANMAEAIARLSSMLRESEDKMIERVNKIDSQFAKGVGQLGALIEELGDARSPV
jgi:hypothetical protein